MSGSGGPLDGYYSQLGQLRSVTDGWRTMPGPVRPLSETTNELTQGAPTWADAWEHNKAAYQDWAEKQRVAGVAAGEIDPETGWPTPAGARSAATSAAMGLVMGSTAPEFQAPRIANPLRAYHGSPHEFPPTPNNPLGEFDPAKVGTGEGAQVYGTGAAYLAENEGIARHYKEALGPGGFTHDGLSSDSAAWLKNMGNDVPGATLDDVRQFAKQMHDPWDEEAPGNRIAQEVEEALDAGKIKARPAGHMYEAEVHIDPEHMLHWDLPLSQQSKYVQERLGKLGIQPHGFEPRQLDNGKWVVDYTDSAGNPRPSDRLFDSADAAQHAASESAKMMGRDHTGEQLYKQLHPDSAAASERLRDAGIPALRYADANSRGRLRTWEAERGQLQDDVAFYESQLGPNATYPSESTAARGVLQRALDQSRKQLADHEANKADIKHNMVVFDPKHIDIVRRYGIGALIGGGAAAGAAQGGE